MSPAEVGPDATLAGGAGISSAVPAAVAHDGGSLDLQAAGSYATVPHDAALDVTGSYTLSTWVNLGDRSDYRPIAVRGSTDSNDIEVYFWPASSNGKLIVAHNRGNGGTFDFVIFPDTPSASWFHLAVTFDGTDVVAFYDGVAQTAEQYLGALAMSAPLDTDKGWMFGAVDHSAFVPGGPTHFQAGLLDEVRLYGTELDTASIGALADYASFAVALAPEEAWNPVGAQHAVTAAVTPALSFIPVDFDVTGANASTGVVMTDEAGSASFSYTGTAAGTDTIVGSIDVVDGQADQVLKHYYEEFAKVSGNTGGPTGRGSTLEFALSGFVGDVPDGGDGTPFGSVTVNYRGTPRRSCTFTPGTSGELFLQESDAVDPTNLVPHDTVTMTGWVSEDCGITASWMQILDNDVPGFPRGAFYLDADDDDYDVIGSGTGGWWPLATGNGFVYDLIL